MRLDDPPFPSPIFAHPIADEEASTFSPIWNRPKPKTPETKARPQTGARKANGISSRR